jgi:hypothetical protein
MIAQEKAGVLKAVSHPGGGGERFGHNFFGQRKFIVS